MKYEYFIALKHLTKRRQTGFISLISLISILGVAVGVMALIVVLAVMSGFDTELKTKIVGVSPHIVIEKFGGIEASDVIVSKIRGLGNEQIKTVAPFVQGQGIIRSQTNAIGTVVKGVDTERENLGLFRKYMRKGAIDLDGSEEKLPGVVIGEELARILSVDLGDEVDVISPFIEKKSVFKKEAMTRSFRVSGIFKVGMNEFDTTLILINIDSAQELYHMPDLVSGISIRLDDVDTADRVKYVIQGELGLSYWVRSWFDLNRNFFSALKVEKTVMTILLLLIILVAAFNIVSTLTMVVMEKTKDIGILRAIGATKKAIRKIFVFEGFTVGFFGVVLGAILGLLLAFNLNPIADFIEKYTGFEVFPSDIYYFDRIPTEINPQDVALIIFFALLTSLLAGLYPARKASELDPIEALRYE